LEKLIKKGGKKSPRRAKVKGSVLKRGNQKKKIGGKRSKAD